MQNDNTDEYDQLNDATSSAPSPQSRMPGLYSLLTAPSMSAFPLVKSEPYEPSLPSDLSGNAHAEFLHQRSFAGPEDDSLTASGSNAGTTAVPTCLDELEWNTFKATASRQLQTLSSDVIHNAVRQKRSRGYIARMLAEQQKDVTVPTAASSVPSSDSEEPVVKKKRCTRTATPETDFAPVDNSLLDDPMAAINMRKWRVKTVVDEHIFMMRSLSATTVSTTKMPGDLKHMDLKPRLLSSDRSAILLYQGEMKKLLDSEYEILQQLRECLRPVTVTSSMVDEQFLATEIITSFDAPLGWDNPSDLLL
ncbi:uncharacterized protein LOC129589932 [Paramacrobiotus metropolitanus]|uniref:uncharacterized protein LOC129589932 n=1 Tax=Paramacrobiotus metropolitanus TaxID=2943436 RepID=UPI0024460108|nr:uncharacterized protein LOC129589932 [Paramacrobiotus metropolitanus]